MEQTWLEWCGLWLRGGWWRLAVVPLAAIVFGSVASLRGDKPIGIWIENVLISLGFLAVLGIVWIIAFGYRSQRNELRLAMRQRDSAILTKEATLSALVDGIQRRSEFMERAEAVVQDGSTAGDRYELKRVRALTTKASEFENLDQLIRSLQHHCSSPLHEPSSFVGTDTTVLEIIASNFDNTHVSVIEPNGPTK